MSPVAVESPNQPNQTPEPLSAKDPYNVSTPRVQRKKAYERPLYMWLAVVILAVLMVIMYILHFTHKTGTSSYTLKGSNDLGSSAVSFNAQGDAETGAGTSFFLDNTELPKEAKYLQYVNVDGNVFASYVQDGNAHVAPVSGKSFSDKGDNTIKGDAIRGSAVVNKQVAFMSVGQAAPYDVSIVPASVDGSSITLNQDKKKKVATGSISNYIGNLDGAFAITYFDDVNKADKTSGLFYQNVVVGTIDTDGKTKLTKPLKFGNETDYSKSTTQIGKPAQAGKDHVLTPWFVKPAEGPSTLGLCAHLSKYDISKESLEKVNEVCENLYEPVYLSDSTNINDNMVAVAFYDKKNNYAMTVLVIEVDGDNIFFRNTYTATGGAFNFGSGYAWSPTPAIEKISETKLAVSFLDASNHGKPVVQILELPADHQLKSYTPAVVLSDKDFSIATNTKAPTSLALDVTVTDENEFAVLYSGSLAGESHARAAKASAKGTPIGVSKSGDVTYDGVVDVKGGNLTPGHTYYATTEGELITHDGSEHFVDLVRSDNTVVVKSQSLVGVAVADDKIHLLH